MIRLLRLLEKGDPASIEIAQRLCVQTLMARLGDAERRCRRLQAENDELKHMVTAGKLRKWQDSN